jgi:putative heme iron utilization protein
VLSATSKHDLPSPATAVRNLMEQARFAHLCTTMSRMHHRRAGYPFGSLVDFGNDGGGRPLLALSPLAIHTRNVLSDPRCTLVVQLPGWSGLANARVTVFGELEQLHGRLAEEAAELLRFKHSPLPRRGADDDAAAAQPKLIASNAVYFRMSGLTDIYFVGGFGTVQWVDVNEYVAATPDAIVTRTARSAPEATLAELNATFRATLPRLFAAAGGVDEALLVSIDRGGVDVRVRHADGGVLMERLLFPRGAETPEQAREALAALLAEH